VLGIAAQIDAGAVAQRLPCPTLALAPAAEADFAGATGSSAAAAVALVGLRVDALAWIEYTHGAAGCHA
jgi:hypothetical protein